MKRYLLLPLVLLVVSCIPREMGPQPKQDLRTSPVDTRERREVRTPDGKPINIGPDAVEMQERVPTYVPIVKVGLLLPLSGDSQELGKSLLDAATLAVYDQYLPLKANEIRAKVVLIPKDIGLAPSNAARVAEEVIAQGASLIIGPVFSPAVSAAAPVARAKAIPLISLSNNKAVAQKGVYVMGFIPEQQVDRISEFAIGKRLTSFGALSPNDDYGYTVNEALKKVVEAKGGTMSASELYARSAVNLDAAVARLQQKYYDAPFNTLFIADGGEQLKDLFAALRKREFVPGKVRFIGTGLWDDDYSKQVPDMIGGWFASSSPTYYRAFEKRFMASYGYKPQRVASLAYDAASLAAQIALEKGTTGFDDATLTQKEGFIGPANGLYRFKPDGTSEHALAVMEITSSGFKVLEQAPRSF